MKILFHLLLMPLVLAVSCKKANNNEKSRWEVRYASPTSYDLVDIDFMDSEHGILLANADMGMADFGQRLIYSEDGGLSWTESAFRLTDGHLMTHIHLFNDLRVIGTTTGGDVMESRDLGKTWNLRGQPVLPSARQIVFPYSETQGFVAAMKRIYRTNDGGMTWIESNFDNSETGAEFIQFPISQEVGYAVWGYTGSLVNKGSVLKTTDAGISWVSIGGAFADILSASFVSNDVGYLFTNDRNLWITRDGGHEWEVVNDQVPISVHASHFVSIKQGFFADKNTGIWMTGDSGKSWDIVVPSLDISSSGSSNTLFSKTEHALYVMINGAIVRRGF